MKNVTLGLGNIFDFLNIRPFSPRGLWTFLVVLAHGVPLHSQIYYQEYRTNIENHQRFRVQRIFFGPNGLAKEILDDDQI